MKLDRSLTTIDSPRVPFAKAPSTCQLHSVAYIYRIDEGEDEDGAAKAAALRAQLKIAVQEERSADVHTTVAVIFLPVMRGIAPRTVHV